MATSTKNILKGFGLGWSSVTLGNRAAIQNELMSALNITTRAQFNNYKSGRQRVTFDQAETVEKIFVKYGIRKIWGEFPEIETADRCDIR